MLNCQYFFSPKKNYFVKIALVFCLSSCANEKTYDKTKAISLIDKIEEIEIDKNLEKVTIKTPQEKKSTYWLASPSHINQNIENIAKNFNTAKKTWFFAKKNSIDINKTWYKNIFYFEDFAKSFVYAPIIHNQKLFNIDSSGDVTAFDLETKKELWHQRIFEKLWLKNYKVAHLGACKKILFAVAGVNQIKAIDQESGAILWSRDLSVIFSSTPICDDENVYITSSDNKTFALNADNGAIKWIHFGIAKTLALFGNAQVVLFGSKAIISNASGDLYVVDKISGKEIWQTSLNSMSSYNANSYLTDIDSAPLVKDNVVYVIGNGGLMKALNLNNGEELWKKPIASVVDFWLAGDFLYVINNNSKLMAIYQKTGTIKWFKQLPQPSGIFNKKHHNYIGTIMVGGKLVITRDDGEILILSPIDGAIESQYSLNKRVLHQPAIVGNKLYFYGMSRFKTKLIELE